MRILLLSSQSPLPITNGIRLRTYHLFSRLADDYEITLLTFYNSPEDLEGLNQLGDKMVNIRALRGVYRNSLVDYIKGSLSATPFFVERTWSKDMQRALANELSATDYDLIFVNDLRMAKYALAHRYLPRVIDACDALSLLFKRAFYTASGLLERLRFLQLWLKTRRYEATMLPNFDLCTVVSPIDAIQLRKNRPKPKVEVVPNGVDIDYFCPNGSESEEENTLVFVGIMDYPPNVDAVRYFVGEVLPLVWGRIPSTRFLVVGRNGSPEGLELDNVRNVEVLGAVPDVRPFLERASIFVCPIRFGAGVKNKVLEAMAMAKPIVGLPLAFEGLNVLPGEHVISASNTEELANSIVNLLLNRQRRVELGKKARIFVEREYSWPAATRRLDDLLRNVVSERARSATVYPRFHAIPRKS